MRISSETLRLLANSGDFLAKEMYRDYSLNYLPVFGNNAKVSVVISINDGKYKMALQKQIGRFGEVLLQGIKLANNKTIIEKPVIFKCSTCDKEYPSPGRNPKNKVWLFPKELTTKGQSYRIVCVNH